MTFYSKIEWNDLLLEGMRNIGYKCQNESDRTHIKVGYHTDLSWGLLFMQMTLYI